STTTPPPVNQRPTVNAGSNQTITLPAKAVLNGAANDDGLPVGSTLTTTWSMVSGPGTVTFGNINALSTDASFSAAGNYVLRLTASDGALSTSADVSIIVNPAPPVTPAPPVPVFTFSPSSPVVGSPISFNASSSTCHASPCSYNWTDDADKSVLGTGATMSFTFSVVGPKYVRLTVTDAQSQTTSVEHDVIVSGTTTTNPPTMTAFTPASGPTGTGVTISGTNFTLTTAVRFNGLSASFTVSSATAIQATVPAGATTGPLTVTTPGGTAPSAGAFTVSGPRVAAFTYSPTAPVVGSPVSFNG